MSLAATPWGEKKTKAKCIIGSKTAICRTPDRSSNEATRFELKLCYVACMALCIKKKLYFSHVLSGFFFFFQEFLIVLK